jgi:hypothetical protein
MRDLLRNAMHRDQRDRHVQRDDESLIAFAPAYTGPIMHKKGSSLARDRLIRRS